ncbi:MAG: diguanylate cyclase [Lachnospiraceae bacterium]
MKSIRTKILSLVIFSVLISTISVAAICLISMKNTLEQDSSDIMNLLCTEKKQEINEQLMNIEQSVNTIYHFAVRQLDDVKRLWGEEEYRNSYLEEVLAVSVNAAENTKGAITVYYRFNQEKAPNGGFFLVKNDRGKFEDYPVTDLSLYDKNDVPAVGWYYIPLENEKATWLEPYVNPSIDIDMISYVIPVYVDGEVIGVIGMDIEVDILYQSVDSVQIYDNGYAFLMDEKGNILYHKDYPDGIKREGASGELTELYRKLTAAKASGHLIPYSWDGQEKRLVSQKLQNNMLFSICVLKSEIDEPWIRLFGYVITSLLLMLAVVILVTIQVSRVMIRPLHQLTEAAQKIANSDLDVSIECNTNDEVGVLARSFQLTAEHLKKYIGYINKLAYTDALTGIRNKTAYEETVELLDAQIDQGSAAFSVVVMDINNLKQMNDTYGHEKGDELIKNVADLLKKVWKEDNVYRIGGDEFVAIGTGREEKNYSNRMGALELELKAFCRKNPHYEIPVQVAQGAAVYEKGRDENFADVFRRADALMYEDKEKKKRIK